MVVGGGGEGKAAGVDKASPGRGCQVGGGFRLLSGDVEVEMVRWRWRDGEQSSFLKSHYFTRNSWNRLSLVPVQCEGKGVLDNEAVRTLWKCPY